MHASKKVKYDTIHWHCISNNQYDINLDLERRIWANDNEDEDESHLPLLKQTMFELVTINNCGP